MVSIDTGIGVGDYLDLTRAVLSTIKDYHDARKELPNALAELKSAVTVVQTDLEIAKELEEEEKKRVEIIIDPNIKDEFGLIKDERSGYMKAGELLRARLKRADDLVRSLSTFRKRIASSSTLSNVQNCTMEIMKSADLLRRGVENKKQALLLGKVQARTAPIRQAPDSPSSENKAAVPLENKESSINKQVAELEGLSKLLDALRDLEKIAVPVFPDVLKELCKGRIAYKKLCITLEGKYPINKIKRVVCNAVTVKDDGKVMTDKAMLEAFKAENKIENDSFDKLVKEEKAARKREFEIQDTMFVLNDIMQNVIMYEIPEDEKIYRSSITSSFMALDSITSAVKSLKDLYVDMKNAGASVSAEEEKKMIDKLSSLRGKLSKKAARLSHEFVETIIFSRDVLKLAFTSHSWALKNSSHAATMTSGAERRNSKRLKLEDPYQQLSEKLKKMHDEAEDLVRSDQASPDNDE